jgi:hypothetical protein
VAYLSGKGSCKYLEESVTKGLASTESSLDVGCPSSLECGLPELPQLGPEPLREHDLESILSDNYKFTQQPSNTVYVYPLLAGTKIDLLNIIIH